MTDGGYDDIAKCDGVGRNVLVQRLQAAAKELKTLFANLTACQIDNTRLVHQRRMYKDMLILLSEVKALECAAEPACGVCARCLAKALVVDA